VAVVDAHYSIALATPRLSYRRHASSSIRCEKRYSSAAALLAQPRDRVDEIERANDEEAKREIVESLVAGIKVRTSGEGKDRRASPK
jgi:hypothetical protein